MLRFMKNIFVFSIVRGSLIKNFVDNNNVNVLYYPYLYRKRSDFMSKVIVPKGYQSNLGMYDTQTAIGLLKGCALR